jgi:hypothetical protein
MSAPLASLFYGDINIETGCDPTLYGYGDLNVANIARINGTTNGINGSTGALVVNGGISVKNDSYLNGKLTVMSVSNLKTTYIDTSFGPFSVSGGNSINISVGSTVNVNSISQIVLDSSLNSANAINLLASNNGGGINVLSGQLSGIKLTAGSGGIDALVSTGNINLTTNNGSQNFIINSSIANTNMNLSLLGNTDSQILIQSSGTNLTKTALELKTINTGNIVISNNGGLAAGAIYTLAGSNGYSLTTNTSGPIQLLARDAPSSFIVDTATVNSNLTIAVTGDTNSKLKLQSSGTSNEAILIENTNTSGGILLTQPIGSSRGVSIEAGSGGFTTTTQIGGGINLTANGASSSFINQTTADGQDLTICVEGPSVSSLILCSEGTGTNALQINSTGISGGITALASGVVSINTSDNVNGINIGTTLTTPIKIGTPTSTTTIYGNLDVKGDSNIIESTIVQINDNIIEINNGPSGTADGGIAIKRYQAANDLGAGDVVSDTAEISGTAQGGSSTTITLASSDTAPDNYYNGYWVKIISNTGAGQVRRIKSYDSLTKIATIYDTIDQTGVLNNPTPIEGLNFSTTPGNDSVYGLYPCHWIISMWDSSANEYALVCSPMVATSQTPPISHYINLHINNLIANNITANTINNVPADIQGTVVLTDNSTLPVPLLNFPSDNGIYIILVRPTTAITTRPYAIFLMGRLSLGSCGQTIRLISVKGSTNEQLNMQWAANSYPELLYKGPPGSIGTTSYTYRLITI